MCKEWLGLFATHPQQIVYMVRVAQSHLETKSLGPLSQLYFNEQLAFTEAQAAGEEYPNTDTLAFFDFTAQQEDESEVQNVQTLQADVVTCLCAPYECAGQVGARSGQGGVKPVLAQGRAEEMPAVLGKWGCDAELWSKIHNKQKLLKYASGGQEDKARRFIERVRNSVANAQAAAARAQPHPTAAASPEMPPLLAEWGCDEELWLATQSKSKLQRFAKDGDEQRARRLIAAVRKSEQVRIANASDLA
jgi:hypothetical protein